MRRLIHPVRLRRSRGFTLLEMVIAMGIMFGSLAAIFQLITIGQQASLEAQFRTEAVIYAETKLQESLAGVIPMQSGSGQVEEDTDWLWSLTVEPGNVDGLLIATMTLTRDSKDALGKHAYSIRRMVRDPQTFLDAALSE